MLFRGTCASSLFAVVFASVVAGCGGADGEVTQADTGVDATSDVGTDTSKPDTATDVKDDTNVDDTLVGTDTAADTSTTDGGSGDSDAPAPWPTCDAQPAGTLTTTIDAIWTASATKPAFDWVSGAYVTAVSQGGCSAGKACQIFLADATSYTSLGTAAHHAIKIFVSAAGGTHFTGIAVGDKVDTAGYGWRYNVGGQNEILLEVNDLLRGCIKKTGTGTVVPVDATLSDLNSVAAYETTYGPVLVKLTGISGTPTSVSTETFGIYTTGGFDAGTDAGTSSVVSLSPFFLPGGTFAGLGFTGGTKINFTSIVGVFGVFIPSAADAGVPTKYLELYPRTGADITKP